MSKPTVHRVQELTESEVVHLTDIHVRAYEGGTGTGGDWSLAPYIARAIIRATLLEGEIYVVKNDSNQIVSFGLWFRPGTEVFSTPEQRVLGFDDFFKKLKPEMQEWYSNTYPEYLKKYLDGVFTKEETSKRWWCSNLVTSPEYQGRGYATAIVNAVLEKVAKQNEFIGLATAPPLNVRKYLSMGFKERTAFSLPSPAGDQVVHVFSKGSA
uniref:N-acetyltransferase domain-containing protein n=1 Tax=Moniliophthora roreri TaxID=221103 RepID=A0A0W0FPK9_MONRR